MTGDGDRPVSDPRTALLTHLRLAAATFGAEFPLPVAGALPPALAAPADAAPDPGAAPAAAEPPSFSGPAVDPGFEEYDEEPPEPVVLPPLELPEDLAGQRAVAVRCRRCKLCETRTQVVFGEGAADADVMFVGEAPGAREDEQGRPFVGPAGQLLNRILENAMGLERDAVYIANVNKCRPPGNRNPEPDEIGACLPYLQAQIRAIRPRVLVTLGRVAAHNLLGTDLSMTRLRGRDLEYDGIPVVATWHPAYLLRNPAAKRETWEDVKRVNRILGRPEDPRQSPSPRP